jgi:hypothetical protein
MTRFQATAAVSEEKVAAIAGRLRRRALRRRALIAVMLIVGVPMLAVGPAVVAGALWLFGVGRYSTLFWTGFLWVTPLLMLLDVYTHGRAGEQAVVAAEHGTPKLGALTGGYAGAQIVLFLVFALFGPGLVVAAVRRLRGEMRYGTAPVERCAEVAAQLLRVPGGVDVASLTGPEVEAALAYLVHYDWAGVGGGGRRAWILSDARGTLAG